jgi:hypothetical protein
MIVTPACYQVDIVTDWCGLQAAIFLAKVVMSACHLRAATGGHVSTISSLQSL